MDQYYRVVRKHSQESCLRQDMALTDEDTTIVAGTHWRIGFQICSMWRTSHESSHFSAQES